MRTISLYYFWIFCILVVVVFDVGQVLLVGEGGGNVQVCARIAEGFLERESDVIIALTAVEFQSEATLCE